MSDDSATVELRAMRSIIETLLSLDVDTRARILRYVSDRCRHDAARPDPTQSTKEGESRG